MKKKIKVSINTPDFKMNLPACPLWLISSMSQFAIKRIDDENLKLKLKENKKIIKDFIKSLDKTLNDYEAFTFLEVESEDTYVLIDVL